jgi:hypothetical protein
MNREEHLLTKSPSIQQFIQPLFCVIPHDQNLLSFVERKNFESSGFNDLEIMEAVANTATTSRRSNESDVIAANTIADFLSLSRKFLDLDGNV